MVVPSWCLKLVNLKSKEPRLRDWNIEPIITVQSCPVLEIKRTSITRLKLDMGFLAFRTTTLLEIKRTSITRLKHCVKVWIRFWYYLLLKSKEPRLRDWNLGLGFGSSLFRRCLKSKEPRLRDWNTKLTETVNLAILNLKSKEPRLRDWNVRWNCVRFYLPSLEIKRTSITRLKREQYVPIGVFIQ